MMIEKSSDEWKALMDEHYGGGEANPYIGRQYKQENESTKALFQFMLESISADTKDRILDAGCGDGGMLNSAKKYFPQAKLSGFDMARDMLTYANKHLPSDIRVDYGDLLNIPAFEGEPFDIIYTVHTLPLFEQFEPLTLSLMRSAKKHIFINSLFSNHNVDIIARVKDEGYPEIVWSIYSVRRFREFVLDNGGKNIEFREFEIPIDLEDPGKGMGSYTRNMENGKRLTFSGPVYLPWYFVRIDI